MDGLTKVYHKGCGGHVGYVADTSKPRQDSSNFYFLNKEQPEQYIGISIGCLKCGGYITRHYMLDLDHI